MAGTPDKVADLQSKDDAKLQSTTHLYLSMLFPMWPMLIRTRSDFCKHFKVVVSRDDTQRSFLLHNDIVFTRSNYLEAARFARWIEYPKGATELRDEDPIIFAMYVHCVYTNRVVVPEPAKLNPYSKFSKLYQLADMLLDTKTKNLVIDEFIRYSDHDATMPEPEVVTRI
jgi:hypothetical protein